MDHLVAVVFAVCVFSCLGLGFYLANQRDSERIACTQEMTAKHPERSTDDILKLCGLKQ